MMNERIRIPLFKAVFKEYTSTRGLRMIESAHARVFIAT
jgi:hypothetical protein